MKALADYKFEELVDEQTGQLLLDIGKGTPARSMVFQLMRLACEWRVEQDLKEKTNGAFGADKPAIRDNAPQKPVVSTPNRILPVKYVQAANNGVLFEDYQVDLRHWRTIRGVTATSLAKYLNVGPNSVTDAERRQHVGRFLNQTTLDKYGHAIDYLAIKLQEELEAQLAATPSHPHTVYALRKRLELRLEEAAALFINSRSDNDKREWDVLSYARMELNDLLVPQCKTTWFRNEMAAILTVLEK